MSKAAINGVQINYEVSGQGFPIVLCHGFTGSLLNWMYQIPEFVHSYRVLAYDHRGHGYSEKPTSPDAYSIKILSEDLFALLNHLGIENCFLVGHSMGGMVAMQFMMDHPECVRALVLVDTAAGQINWEQWEEESQIARDIALKQGMEALFYYNVSRDPALQKLQTDDPEQFSVSREEFLLNSPEAYIHCGHAMREREPLLNRLKEIQVPTLVIVGEDDEPLVEPSREIAINIPAAELEIIPGAAHSPTKEAPETFNSILGSFLQRVGGNAV